MAMRLLRHAAARLLFHRLLPLLLLLLLLSHSQPETLAFSIPPLSCPPSSAYIHIPFCKQRCFYCDFPIKVLGHGLNTPNVQQTINKYVDNLIKEIDASGRKYSSQESTMLQTVYVGGGTPSVLDPQHLEQILSQVDKTFGIAKHAEISIEMDPGTFDKQKAAAFKALGFTRVSMGVQSFNEQSLKSCGRGHTVQEVFEGFSSLSAVGFHDISMDLISGLPGETEDRFLHSLQSAVDLNPTHLSVYDLIIEDHTAFGRWYDPSSNMNKSPMKLPSLPGESMAGDFYTLAHEFLTSRGYEHYEISNYARLDPSCIVDSEDIGILSPFHSRHNTMYWDRRPFYGFGMGATSFTDGVRLARPRNLEAYFDWVEGGMDPKQLIGWEQDDNSNSAWDTLVETFMVGLRTRRGVMEADLRKDFGDDLVHEALRRLQQHVTNGLVEITRKGRIRLTAPRGFLYSNTVLVSLFK